MAFKDLRREILEEFAETSHAEYRVAEAKAVVETKSALRARVRQQATKFDMAFKAKLTRRKPYQVPRLPSVVNGVSCAVCRVEFFSHTQLGAHFGNVHPDLARAYRLSAAPTTAQRDRDKALLGRLERQLAAAKDLAQALEARIARLSEKLRRI